MFTKHLRFGPLIVVICLSLLQVAHSAPANGDWTTYGGDPTGSKHSGLKQINRVNVRRLNPAWIYRCEDMQERPASTIECNPIIVGGRMYVTTPCRWQKVYRAEK